MKTTVEYLDAAKARLSIDSDYAAAKALGVTRAAVSRYRTGTGTFDDLTAARVAEILGVAPIEVIAAVNYERTKDVRGRAVWESIWGKAAGAIALNLILCAVGVSVTPTSEAAESRSETMSVNRHCHVNLLAT